MRIILLTLIYYSCAIFGVLNPLFGLLFFVHIVIFRPESLVWGNPIFGRLHLFTAGMLFIGGFLQPQMLRTKVGLNEKRNLFFMVLLIAWLVMVSVWAEVSARMSFEKTFDLIKIFAVCFVFTKLITNAKRIDQYLWISMVSFGLLSFWGFLQGMAGNPRLDDLWPGGSNYIGAQLALMTPVALSKSLDKDISFRARSVFIACALSMVLCILATQSRGAFLGLSIGCLGFLLTTRYRVRALVVIAFVVIVSLPWALQPSRSEVRQDSSVEARLVLWKIALLMWKDHFIAGVGLNNFSPLRRNYQSKFEDVIQSVETKEIVFDSEERYPHGLYTGMLAETGTVGMVLFLMMLLHNIWVSFPRQFARRESTRGLYLLLRGVQAGLLGFAVSAIFGDYQYIEMLYFQLFLVGAIRDSISALATVDVTETADINLSLARA